LPGAVLLRRVVRFLLFLVKVPLQAAAPFFFKLQILVFLAFLVASHLLLAHRKMAILDLLRLVRGRLLVGVVAR
tara:strand:+ start:48 stop:269 length:222 start_codon:yes stop_codon:yes gene_type:complete